MQFAAPLWCAPWSWSRSCARYALAPAPALPLRPGRPVGPIPYVAWDKGLRES